MSTVKVILATLVIFGAGVLTGAIALRLALFRVPLQTAPANPGPRLVAPSTVFNRPDFLERLSREASLRADQRKQVEQILQESRKRTEPIAQEFAPMIRAEVQRVREQILLVLDADQKSRFEEILRPRANQPARPGGRGSASVPTALTNSRTGSEKAAR